jgi:C-terminal processing protease CtpA/Prc
MLLVKSKDFARVDSYDRAGVWMGQDAQGFFAVDVVAGGPADVAGIRKDDRLLEIDGVATTKLILPEVRERMRRGTPGSRVKILVEHDGARRVVEIRLRDLV